MKPVNFQGENFNLTAPEGMTKEQCGDLPCFIDRINGRIVSCWELSDDELREIKRTKKVWLAVHACPPPPVSLTTEKPAFVEVVVAPATIKKFKNKRGEK